MVQVLQGCLQRNIPTYVSLFLQHGYDRGYVFLPEIDIHVLGCSHDALVPVQHVPHHSFCDEKIHAVSNQYSRNFKGLTPDRPQWDWILLQKNMHGPHDFIRDVELFAFNRKKQFADHFIVDCEFDCGFKVDPRRKNLPRIAGVLRYAVQNKIYSRIGFWQETPFCVVNRSGHSALVLKPAWRRI